MEAYIYSFIGWLLGGFAGGVAGFGGMMTALPIMTIGMPTTDAVLTCCITGAPGCTQLGWLYRKNVVWSEMKWLWLSCLPGCMFGAYVLKVVSMQWLQIGISLLIVIFLLLRCFESKITWRLKDSVTSLCVTGFLSGFANSSVSIVGVPIGIFILLKHWDKDHSRSTMGVFFVMSGWLTLISQYFGDLYSLQHLYWAGAALVGSLIGQYVGFQVGKHINQKLFINFILAFLTIAAILLFYKALK